MEDTSSIDITQHPEFKLLQNELTTAVEEMKKKDQDYETLLQNNDDAVKKYKDYKAKVGDLQKQNSQLKEQVSMGEKSIEKLRKQRNENQKGWEESDAKL